MNPITPRPANDGERLSAVENELGNLRQSIESLKKDVKDDIDRLANAFEGFCAKADKRYASRDRLALLEKVTYGAIGAVLLAVLYAVLRAIGI